MFNYKDIQNNINGGKPTQLQFSSMSFEDLANMGNPNIVVKTSGSQKGSPSFISPFAN